MKNTLDNAIAAAAEANATSTDTLVKLNSQKEQLRKVDSDLNDINATMDKSERVIKGMKSLGGALANKFTSPKAHEDTTFKGDDPLAKRGGGGGGGGAKADSDRRAAGPGVGTRQAQTQAKAEPNTRVDAQLDTLHDLMSNLHMQGQDMQTELAVHDSLIDHVDQTMDRTGPRLQKAVREMKKIT